MKGKPWKKGLSVLTAVLMLFCAVLPVFPELADRVEVTAAAASDSTRNITYILKGTFGDKEYHKMIVQSHTAGSKVKLYGMKETFANYCYGYEFKGWKAPSGTMYAAGQEVAWIDDVRLNAVLEPLPRTITYKANGGTGADIVTQRLAGEATVLEPYDIFTRTGYFHYSWNTKPDGSGTNYFPGWTVKWTGNVTLYAKWVSEDDETIQTITYKSNGAGADDVVQKSIRRTSPDSTYVTYRQVLYPADTFTRYGYTFTGWIRQFLPCWSGGQLARKSDAVCTMGGKQKDHLQGKRRLGERHCTVVQCRCGSVAE